ncbi:MAG: hypothetical protein HYU30_04050 [Chloroflexi bacterium]|nr:hypothetical protein [Chloroflexota bacterium]
MLRQQLRENVALRFALAASVMSLTVVVVGVGIAYALRMPIESAVREEAVRDTVTEVLPRLLKMVAPQDVAQPITGASYEHLDRMVRDYALSTHAVRLKIWNSEGLVVYSTLESQVGESYPDSEELQEALQGKTVWEVSRETEAPEERAFGELMEIYVPLAWEAGAKPAGVMEVYLDYAPYSRLLTLIRNAIFGAVALVGASVILAMFVLYRTGYQTIQKQRDVALQRQREVTALNHLLQQDLAHYYDLKGRLLGLRAEIAQDPRFQPDAAPVSARDAWLLMQLRELAEFAADIMAAEEQKQPERDGG